MATTLSTPPFTLGSELADRIGRIAGIKTTSVSRGYCSCHEPGWCALHTLNASDPWHMAYEAYMRSAWAEGWDEDSTHDAAEHYANRLEETGQLPCARLASA